MFGAVGLFHRHFQVAAVGGGVKVVELKRSGGYVLLVDEISVLAHRDDRIRAGDAANDRCIAALAIGQHFFVRGEIDAPILQAVEHFAARAALARGELRSQRVDVVLQESVDVIPL